MTDSSSVKPEYAEVEAPGLDTPRGDGYRIERTAWVVMLALPLLVYCVVALLTYAIKPTPITTGDALYDKYLAWVADDLVDSSSEGYYSQYESRWEEAQDGNDYDPFAAWEAEFSDDPRYWMLRYRYYIAATRYDANQRRTELICLDRARELGVADGPILLILLNACDNKVWDDAHYYKTSGQSNNEYRTEMEKYQRGQVDGLMGEEHDQLLAELLAVAGNEALPHYYAAKFDSQRGDYAAAISHLADGNRAPDNSSLYGFPFQDYTTILLAGNPLPDKHISGSILMGEQMLPLPNYTEIKQMVKVLTADAVSRNDRAALDEIHTFACRFGKANGSSWITSLVALVMIAIVNTEYSIEHGGTLSAEQARSLSKVSILRAQVKNHFRTSAASMPYNNPLNMPLSQRTLWLLEGTLSGGRSAGGEIYVATHDYYVQQNSSLNLGFQLLEQIESFNYNTLEFE